MLSPILGGEGLKIGKPSSEQHCLGVSEYPDIIPPSAHLTRTVFFKSMQASSDCWMESQYHRFRLHVGTSSVNRASEFHCIDTETD